MPTASLNSHRIYRIEGGSEPQAKAGGGPDLQRHKEIMDAFAGLRELVAPTRDVSALLLDEHRRDMQEAMRLKVEMDSIAAAIQRTKLEIATLHYAGAQGREMSRVTDELGAIVVGTETATHSILAAAERIDELAGNLRTRLAGDDRDLAGEIADHIVNIFVSCNFQDITGQRISKVVNAMRFVEERVQRMIEIWGGLESFQNVQVEQDPGRAGDKALLNGPPLETDDGRTSQDDIDALFA